jgi:F-type H+-transporting ATPase subunit a
MPHQLFFTKILNDHLAAPVTALLEALHVHPKFPEAPITKTYAKQFLFLLELVAYFVLERQTLDF